MTQSSTGLSYTINEPHPWVVVFVVDNINVAMVDSLNYEGMENSVYLAFRLHQGHLLTRNRPRCYPFISTL